MRYEFELLFPFCMSSCGYGGQYLHANENAEGRSEEHLTQRSSNLFPRQTDQETPALHHDGNPFNEKLIGSYLLALRRREDKSEFVLSNSVCFVPLK